MSESLRTRWVVIAALVVGLVAADATAHAGADEDCVEVKATIIGTPDDDAIEGTPGDDVIAALAGDDEIAGLEGGDLICGGAGNDVIRGFEGSDGLLGEGGNDRLFEGNDGGSSVGGSGDDLLRGSGTFLGGTGNDVMKGTEPLGSVYHADSGDDRIIDQGGQGRISYAQSPRPLHADLGEGTVRGWGHDTVRGMRFFSGSERGDVIRGSGAAESIDGVDGFDRVDGRGGDDGIGGRGVLEGGRGDDNVGAHETPDGSGSIVRGGPGSDGSSYLGYVNADLREGIARYERDGNDHHVLRSIENLDVTDSSGSVLIGDAADNLLTSEGGTPAEPDVLRGRGGDDLLEPGLNNPDPQNLSLFGGTGNDRLRGGEADDELFGGPGDDKIRGEAFAYYDPSNDFLDGGEGTDDLDGGLGTDECVNGETVNNCES